MFGVVIPAGGTVDGVRDLVFCERSSNDGTSVASDDSLRGVDNE